MSDSNHSGGSLTNAMGLYFHLPLCTHRCSYCDFYSMTEEASGSMESLVEKISQDLAEFLRWHLVEWGRRPVIESVFFGGGTPSLFPAAAFQRIFGVIEKEAVLDSCCEVTTEANPESVNYEWLRELRAVCSLNRVSLGVQSFSQKFLETLDRRVRLSVIPPAVDAVGRAGISNFSVDLIFGIPGQTVEEMLQDVRQAALLGPKHVSFYQLTLKPGHPLFSRLPDEDLSATLYEEGISQLEASGFSQYEISNFARPGFESRHNLLYWTGKDFAGFGPSASSRLFRKQSFFHWTEPADLKTFMEKKTAYCWQKMERTSPSQTALEAVFLELRKNCGIDLRHFHSRYGYQIERSRNYEPFRRHGLIVEEQNVLRFTPRGRLLADRVSRELVDL